MHASEPLHCAPDDVPTDPVQYDNWVRDKVQKALDDPRPSIPHDTVMAEMRALIAQTRQTSEDKGN